MYCSYLSLGSNLGDKEKNMGLALRNLERDIGVFCIKISPIYTSRAIGPGQQDSYLNAVVKIQTSYSPQQLLELCWQLENQANRRRNGILWEARTLDVDILIYDEMVIDTDKLQVPHPDIFNRDFVLIPLLEVLDRNLHIGGELIYQKAIRSLKHVKSSNCELSFKTLNPIEVR